MARNRGQNGWKIIRNGTKKQVKAQLQQQDELREALQPVTDASETIAHSNNKIIRIIDLAIKPELEKRKDEHKALSEQSGGSRSEKEARSQRLDILKTEIENRLLIMNLISLLASHTPSTRKDYGKLLTKQAKIKFDEAPPYEISFCKEALRLLRDTLQGQQRTQTYWPRPCRTKLLPS